jgi:hypothetical protein
MPRSTRILALLLSGVFFGCGRQAESLSAGQAESGDKPAAAGAASSKAAEPVKAGPPATIEEVVGLIDLRKLARFEGARVTLDKATWFNCSVPGKMADGAEFYRKQLTDLGWIEDKTPIPGMDASKYFFAGFDKGAFRVNLSVNKNYKDEGIIDISLTNLGNVDIQQFPRQDDAKPTFVNRHYVSYKTAAKPDAIIDFYRKDLTAHGWREQRVSSAKFHAKEGRFLLGFANNAIGLHFNIHGEKDGSTVVDYRVEVIDKPGRVAGKEVPKPATLAEGQKAIDFNRFPRMERAEPGVGTSAKLQYSAPGRVEDARRFYRQKLTDAGWKEQPSGTIEEDSSRSRFTKSGYQLEFSFGKSNKADWVNIQVDNLGNADLRQLPRVPNSDEDGLDSFANVHYVTATPLEAAANFFRKELPTLGWKEFKGESKDYPEGRGKLLVFGQNACTLHIDVTPDEDGEVGVHILSQFYGEWIPRPRKPEEVLYVIDLREFPRMNKAPVSRSTSASVLYPLSAGVRDAIRFYESELKKTGWQRHVTRVPESDDRAVVRFIKENFILEVEAMTNEGGKGITVSVNNRGNLELKRLLHPEDAVFVDPKIYNEETKYTTTLKPDQVIEFYRQEWPKFGWQLVKEPQTIPSHIEMVFVQHSMKLVVQIAANADKKTEVDVQSWIVGLPAN